MKTKTKPSPNKQQLPIWTISIILVMAAFLAACGSATPPASDQADDGAPRIDVIQGEDAPSSPTIAVREGSQDVDSKGLPVGFTEDGYPYRGNLDAPVLIEEFSDFQCPFCGRFFAQTLPSIEDNQVANGDAVIVFYDFPLTNIHPQAMAAHNAAQCAADQGAAAFWGMHDLIFGNFDEWANSRVNDYLNGYAQSLNLDMAAFEACVENETHFDAIQDTISLGFDRGVQSTPSFFINERPLIGAQPLSTFNSMIADALNGTAVADNAPDTADTPTNNEPYPTPAPANIDLSLAAAAKGSPDAPVTVVEFSDYQCPYCQRHALQTMPNINTEMIDSGQVYYVFMDFPLDNIHPEARGAAAAARCAGEQGVYWEYHDALFANVEQWAGQGSGAAAVFASLAEPIVDDAAQFTACLESGKYDTAVNDSLNEGLRLGVNSTPSFMINGYPMAGAQPFETFVQIIDLAKQNELGSILAEQQRQAEEAAAQAAEQQADPQPVDVPIGDAYTIGSPDAPVTIVEYTDFQCPFCQRHATQTMPAIIEKYVNEGIVRYVFKDFPLTSIHAQAVEAAEAARCTLEQNEEAYLPMHDMLFSRQQEWADNSQATAVFISFADELGLDTTAFEACLTSNKYEEAIMADLDEGVSLGVNGTPAFFINGYFVSGAQPIELFDSAVQYFVDGGNE